MFVFSVMTLLRCAPATLDTAPVSAVIDGKKLVIGSVMKSVKRVSMSPETVCKSIPPLDMWTPW